MKKDDDNNWQQVRAEGEKIDSLTDHRIRQGVNQKIQSIKNRRKTYWMSAAAAVFIGVGALVFTSTPEVSHKKETVQLFTSAEFTKKITLSDGSIVVLQPHSQLVLSKDFGATDRQINFTGKATFDIAKDKNKPFRINAKDFTVQVLGTKFFLDQTQGQEKVELFEGKVKINHEGKVTYLMPNQAWVKNEVKVLPATFIVKEVRDFSFEDEAFDHIISELEIVYHVKIEYPQQYAKERIKGSFSGNLDEVLSAVSYPFNLKTEKKSENNITLK